MYGYLNLGSIVFGLIAWALPVAALLRKRTTKKPWGLFTAGSLAACSLSLFMQILYTDYKVYIEDFSALLDTHFAITGAAIALLVVTLLLNVGVVFAYLFRKK